MRLHRTQLRTPGAGAAHVPAEATYSISVSGVAQALVGACSVVKRGEPLVLARCTRRRAAGAT